MYLFSLIGIGYWGMRARKENSLKDFYLAGSGVGFHGLGAHAVRDAVQR